MILEYKALLISTGSITHSIHLKQSKYYYLFLVAILLITHQILNLDNLYMEEYNL